MKKLGDIDAILFDMMGVLLFQKKNYIPNKLVDEIDKLVGSVTNDTNFKKETLKNFNLSETQFNTVLEKIVNKYEPFQNLWDLLPALREHYKLAIINNGTALTLNQFNENLCFNKYFDLFISSAKEGIKKPNKQIFLVTAKHLSISPNKCLFMDDSKENIKGAQNVGMQTIFWPNQNDGFRNFAKLINN